MSVTRTIGGALCLSVWAVGIALAQGTSAPTTPPGTPPPATPAADEKPKPWLALSGGFNFDGYSQNNFLLGRPLRMTRDPGGRPIVAAVSDHDEYAIQMFRLQTEFGVGDNVKAVVRSDWAQGLWGVDDERATGTGGFSNLFDNKDTNFGLHVDWAYLDYTHTPCATNAKVGRFKHVLGNMLVLDQDSDGIALTRTMKDKSAFSFTWAQMYEGANSLSDRNAVGPNPTGATAEDALDAALYALTYQRAIGAMTLKPFAAFYQDRGADDGPNNDGSAYLPDGQAYRIARFTPQLSQATVAGVAFEGKKNHFEYKGELDYLTGQDHIANKNSGGNQLLDVNNGKLSGMNLYLDGKAKVGKGKLGVVIGYGSGDDDPMSGEGNINRIRTQGFFYVNEIWEDSIMPDEEGITPQGLGSPASRAYREFENSTLAQLNWTWDPHPKFTHMVSATLIRSTEELHPWGDTIDTDPNAPGVQGNGAIDPGEVNLAEGSNDLGKEIDTMLTYKLHPNLNWVLRGGILLPGDGLGYLMTGGKEWKLGDGTTEDFQAPWEIRTTISYSFSGLKIGG